MTAAIELMHSYPGFPGDVLEAFKNLMEKHKLIPRVEGICSVDLDNRFARLNFNMDRYDLQGLIYRKRGILFKRIEPESQSISKMADELFPGSDFLKTFPVTTYGNKDQTRQLLFWYAEITDKYLGAILNGEFTNSSKSGNI